jgi:hypothetical protein
MRNQIENKLALIRKIWADYIWEFKFCNDHVKFTEDVKSNYFADILNYFNDSIIVLYSSFSNFENLDTFERSISFLQTIYVHQDLIEESLHIFKCGILKGHLQKDDNYLINREIRNELVGHPIRKEIVNHQLRLKSSTIFHYYDSGKDNIAYVKYHIDNRYQGELVSHSKKEVLFRHEAFLIKYLDKIIDQCFHILKKFKKKVLAMEKARLVAPFEKVVQFISDSFEKFAHEDYFYKKHLLLNIYPRIKEHKRYKIAIDTYYAHLEVHLHETILDINNILGIIEKNPKPTITDDFYDARDTLGYHYELSKLLTKRELNFKFASQILARKCSENNLVLNELNHMRDNLNSDLECYCSYNFIVTNLGKK